MKVLVIGAGYAGAMAANRLAKKVPSAEITVVNPRPDFVERIRLHEHVVGRDSATTPLREVLDSRVALRVGTVEHLGDGKAALDDGAEVVFDYALYAAGGAPSEPAGTLDVCSLESAEAARRALAELRDGAQVTVVGGGLTGIETAAEVAEARPSLRVRLLSDTEIGMSLHPSARATVRAELNRLGVWVDRGTYDPAATDAELTLWAVANRVSDLGARSGLAVDENGRVLVDEFLRSVTDPRVFAIGDGAAVPNSRMSCQAAMPQGAYAADTLARIAKGRAYKPYSMGFTGQCVSIGRDVGLIQVSRRDDTPTRFFLRGRPAALLKEQVCRFAARGARTAAYAWLPGPAGTARGATRELVAK